MISAYLPASFEGFFRLFARECATGAPNMSRIAPLAHGYGLALLSPESAAHYTDRGARNEVTAKIVLPNQGEPRKTHTHCCRILLQAKDTEGALGLIEVQTLPGQGVALHSYTGDDAVFMVQEGFYEFELSGSLIEVGPESAVYVPRHHAHSFRATGEKPGRMLVLLQPHGSAESFMRST
jgi:mannose-6-phosphate isomerase-like protein (cupin superfamily)